MALDVKTPSSTIEVDVPIAGFTLSGDLATPVGSGGLILFAHGSGSSRHSLRNQFVARALEEHGLATLLIDLLTPAEGAVDAVTAHHRFDIGMLAERLVAIVDWLRRNPATADRPIGLFGARTGAGAALIAAGRRPLEISAVVSRGGRPDLAGRWLPQVVAPTLLIVGGRDSPVVQLNRDAMTQMNAQVVLEIVPGATHLFEEPGALARVAELAGEWFGHYLQHSRMRGRAAT
jgi:dienelactone hydrolase